MHGATINNVFILLRIYVFLNILSSIFIVESDRCACAKLSGELLIASTDPENIRTVHSLLHATGNA